MVLSILVSSLAWVRRELPPFTTSVKGHGWVNQYMFAVSMACSGFPSNSRRSQERVVRYNLGSFNHWKPSLR